MPPDLLRRWPLLVALAILGFGVPLSLGARASLPPPVYFLHDQQHYREMATPGAARRVAPYSWRLLPSAIVRATGLPAGTGFHALTLTALALIPPAIAIMMAAAGISAGTALMAGAIAAFAPAVAGYLSWDFIRPDGLSLLLIVLAASAAMRGRPVVFAAAMAALSVTKETWVIAAAFALVWSRAYARSFWKSALAGTLLALAAAVAVRLAIPSAEPYSWAANARDLYWPLDPRTVSRRLLLATTGTWTVLTPLAAFALARHAGEPRAWTVGLCVTIATAQILVAIDTQRLVAAALPFILLACAWELDRLDPTPRAAVAGALAAAQIPWLLSYARIWTPPLRGIEIVLLAAAAAAAILARRQRSLTM
ncbi:MAG TPA: hypothetical protein VFK57_07140 [Vicinamibacterales bacterium]|nr:hypothetical protein [Vicinamibacterales bacterium]